MKRIFLYFILVLLASTAHAFDQTHAAWTELLSRHVVLNEKGTASQVDYAGFKTDEAALDTYRASLTAVSPADYSAFSADQKLAFLINAYNANTVALILTRYPDLKSIKDLGSLFSSPWKQRFFSLLGSERSLDDIEQTLIRGAADYREPRVHFALNCASIGCPALRNEAYSGAQLGAQLADQAHRFLSDRTRNRYNAEKKLLEVSKIFDWYGADFQRGFNGDASVAQFLGHFSKELSDDPQAQTQIAAGQVEIDFLDYEWKLNAKR